MKDNFPLSPDDPRLTAYAFDEMAPAERAEFEQLLQRDPAARQAVEEIRAAGVMLTDVLEHEPVIPAAPVAAKPDGNSNLIRFPQLYYMVSGLAAACFAVFFVYWQTHQPVHDKPKQYVAYDLQNAAQAKAAPAQPAAVAMEMPPPPAPAAVVAAAGGLTQQVLTEQAQETRKNGQNQNATFGDSMSYANTGASAEGKVRSQLLADNADKRVALATTVAMKTKREVEFRAAEAQRFAANSPVNGVQAPIWNGERDANTEAYGYRKDNDFLGARDNPLSTFSIDVDTAAYANMRRFLASGRRPPPDAVRIEEMVNYFPYHYTAPTGDVPFSANLEVASAPWAPEHRLVRIGLKGREVSDAARPAANLVFLLDVSGSMQQPNKLPLVKQSLHLLVDKLRADDRVAIAVYAGASGLALPSTPASHKAEILEAIDRLQAEGSTNGAMGIQLAYDIAKANFITGGVNRVILATDGDFNVGVTNEGDLTRLITEKAKSGVFLTVLGFGMGNYKDTTLESLADKGNGNYAYIDTLAEAKKSLVEQAGGTLVTIAKDVKIQVEFNPSQVQAYRLIGYENRLLKKEDFNDDKVDAGEIGAGHTVTALYEVVPVGAKAPEAGTGTVNALKYQRPVGTKMFTPESLSGEMLTVNVRYKEPAADESRKLEFPLRDGGARFEDATQDFKFAAAVAGFGMILRESPYKGSATFADVTNWGRQGLNTDAGGYRSEFLGLVEKAQALQ